MKPLVSCIIPSYNNNKIFDAINSVLNQDYPRIELIITDDGSKDFSEKKVINYIINNRRKNIESENIIIHSENIGTVKNLNCAYDVAKGDYYITLAADDIFYDETVISKIVDRFLETNEDLIVCSRLRCDIGLNPIEVLPTDLELEKIKKLDTPEKQYKSFITFDFFDIASGSAMYFSKDFFRKYGKYNEKYKLWEDGPKLVDYVKTGKKINGSYDIISIKYRDGGVSASGYVGISGKQLGMDHNRFIKDELIPNRKGTNFKRRRYFMFNYYWENAKSNKERIICMLKYPEYGFEIAKRKLNI